MRASTRTRRLALSALAVSVTLTSVSVSSAPAAGIVNGGFETGSLEGWHLHRVTGAGNWFAYSETAAPIGRKRKPPADPVQVPPRGDHAAVTDEANPDTLILHQDIALEAGKEHRLSLLAFYDSYKPIAVPRPNTLSVDDAVLGSRKNQQLRIDVIEPAAPIETLEPTDILRTLFVTEPGDPLHMGPTRFSVNLTPFAGRTVRLRIANAVHEEVFNAGVDDVRVETAAPGQLGGGGAFAQPELFKFRGFRANPRRGTAVLRLLVSGPGLVRVSAGGPRRAQARTMRPLRRTIEPIAIPLGRARAVLVHLRPTRRARLLLRKHHRLRFNVAVTFMPLGGGAETAVRRVSLRLAKLSK